MVRIACRAGLSLRALPSLPATASAPAHRRRARPGARSN